MSYQCVIACLSVDNSEVVIPTEAWFCIVSHDGTIFFLARNLWLLLQYDYVNTKQMPPCTTKCKLQSQYRPS